MSLLELTYMKFTEGIIIEVFSITVSVDLPMRMGMIIVNTSL